MRCVAEMRATASVEPIGRLSRRLREVLARDRAGLASSSLAAPARLVTRAPQRTGPRTFVALKPKPSCEPYAAPRSTGAAAREPPSRSGGLHGLASRPLARLQRRAPKDKKRLQRGGAAGQGGQDSAVRAGHTHATRRGAWRHSISASRKGSRPSDRAWLDQRHRRASPGALSVRPWPAQPQAGVRSPSVSCLRFVQGAELHPSDYMLRPPTTQPSLADRCVASIRHRSLPHSSIHNPQYGAALRA